MSKESRWLLLATILVGAALMAYHVGSFPKSFRRPAIDENIVVPVDEAKGSTKEKKHANVDEPLTPEKTSNILTRIPVSTSTEQSHPDSELSPTDILFGPIMVLRHLGKHLANLDADARKITPLQVPLSSDIDRIVLDSRYHSRFDDEKYKRVITDKVRIERALTFIGEHNDDWQAPWGTPPFGKWRMSFMKGKRRLLCLEIGTNWFGCEKVQSRRIMFNDRVHSLSEADRDELCEMLDIEEYWNSP